MKQLSIGQSDFRRLISDGANYVDKTLLVKEIINDPAQVILLPRPRRFGKTLNLSMLRYFFEKTDTENLNRNLFTGLQIEKEPEFEKHFGKYPVIFITFKDVKFRTFNGSKLSIARLIADEFSRFQFLLDGNKSVNKYERTNFNKIMGANAAQAVLADSLKFLSRLLCSYYNQNVVFLIDEYDTPIITAYTEGYYEEMVSFFRTFFGAAVKDNAYLKKVVFTGILRVARESFFSGINNLATYTLLNYKYADKFGFNQKEVDQLTEYYKLQAQADTIKAWYNGYIFGKEVIYNPWSIINFINQYEEGPKPYWANTSSNDIIKDLIKDSLPSIKSDFELLLKDIPVEKQIDENIVFPELKSNDINIYSFLLFSGYLKAYDAKQVDDVFYYKLLIPNTEVKLIFKRIIENWFSASYQSDKVNLLLKSLTMGDIGLFERLLSDFVVNTLSYFDTQNKDVERVYQAFLLGLLVNLGADYEVNSNRESGYGRYDIAIIPKDIARKAIIMELKKIDEFKEETKDQALDSALQQIEDKQYESLARARGCVNILKIAVTFDGKRVWVKLGALPTIS